MVLKVPRFSSSVLTLCSVPYSLLGFGDILVPGACVYACVRACVCENAPKSCTYTLHVFSHSDFVRTRW